MIFVNSQQNLIWNHTLKKGFERETNSKKKMERKETKRKKK